MISMILRLVVTLLGLASLALLIYCVMSFVMPDSPIYRKAAYYMERVLAPIRWQLFKWFPALRSLPVDLSPLALWLLIDIATALINMLRRIF